MQLPLFNQFETTSEFEDCRGGFLDRDIAVQYSTGVTALRSFLERMGQM